MTTPYGWFTTRRGHAFSTLRVRVRLAFVVLALFAPHALSGQGLDHTGSVPPRGPWNADARAGIGAQGVSNAVITPRASAAAMELVQRDSSGHHGSRAHHAAVGALIGGAVGLAIGVAGDRPGLGRGELSRGHFHNLWLVTAPLGALIGALAGTLRQAD